ncbi:histidine phosphatase family protein [Branchiibius sp. NY16-3462-2]|uniref:histidine phosphatase family protein n=1 Tax=Branchiibius sp. NY16-3462-2 TaxID=1807500 RepID=UPI00079ADF7B|nr:histidine phosphatase family protein [Branchiibius sp. NY16-3462-2]KYH44540.1 phosphoglycerate mutase [Branchiibius sp. NY16-3462-2]
MTQQTDRKHFPDNYIVLIRHGETKWSLTGQHTGVTDLPLLPEGEEGARRAGELIKHLDIGHVFVSPLLRARQTAELAGFKDYEIDEDLREWDYGGYEGLTTDQIREKIGNPDWEIFTNGVVPGDTPGETVEDVSARVSHVVNQVLPLLEESNVALVAHGHSLRIFAATFLQKNPRFAGQLRLDAGAVSILGYYHQYPSIEIWNRRERK